MTGLHWLYRQKIVSHRHYYWPAGGSPDRKSGFFFPSPLFSSSFFFISVLVEVNNLDTTALWRRIPDICITSVSFPWPLRPRRSPISCSWVTVTYICWHWVDSLPCVVRMLVNVAVVWRARKEREKEGCVYVFVVVFWVVLLVFLETF